MAQGAWRSGSRDRGADNGRVRPSRPALLLSAALVVPVALLLLAGCGPDPAPTVPPTPPPSSPTGPIDSPTLLPSNPGTATPEPSDDGTPIALGCDQLVAPNAIYAFNPNFTLLEEWTPAAGSLGARAVNASGVACRWVSESGGVALDVSAARPGTAALAALEAEVDGGDHAPYGEDSWFSLEASEHGRLVIFAGDTWIAISSAYLGEAGDADPIADAALTALGYE